MKAEKFIEEVQDGKIDVVQHTKEILAKVKAINQEYFFFTKITEELAIKLAERVNKAPSGKLAGLAISVKDCICIQDVETTSSSRILKGYKPVFTATIIQKLIDEGAIILGKTVQDEFGFGSFCQNTGKDIKPPKNPVEKTRVTGGSSGGAAGITKLADFPHVAIAESTGGSIVTPAAFCGVIGLCPTYGVVSRFGLLDYANSCDKIGPMGKNLEDVELVYDLMLGKDPNDSTSVEHPRTPGKKNPTIGIIKDYIGMCDKAVQDVMQETVAKLKEKGITVKEIKLPFTTNYALESYYIIAMSEASTNLAKLTGIRYGIDEPLEEPYNEYFSKVRGKHFGDEAKRRIILGTFARMAGYRDAYYVKAAQIRKLIIDEYKAAFKEVDLLLTPTVPTIAPKKAETDNLTPKQEYAMDILTAGPNLAGLPHMNIPVGEQDGLPIGIMFIANHFHEKTLFEGARLL